VTVPVREAGEYLSRSSFYDLDSSDINRMTSTHFQIVWGSKDHSKVDEAFVEGNLANLERLWDTFIGELGFAEPSTSTDNPDGFLYKTNVYITETGLSEHEEGWAFMGAADGFAHLILNPGAMRVDPPSWVIPHEFGHAITLHQEGGWNNNDQLGPWWESAAEWFVEQYLYSDNYAHDGTQYGPETGFFGPMLKHSHYWLAHGTNYYDCWPLLQYLHENPDGLVGYGDGFIVDLMQDTSADQNIYEMIGSLAPETSVKDALGHLTKRMAAVDFDHQDLYLDARDDLLDSRLKKYRVLTELEPVPDRDGWWRVPIEHAPLQSGFNIVELEPTGGTITVELEGIEGVRPDADWRAALVAEEDDGSTRYSELIDGGTTSLSVAETERCYLTVAATPDEMLDVSAFENEADRPFDSSPAKQRFPYEVSLSGAEPAETTDQPDGDGWSRHPNGGGYVANSASVAQSAYVGSNALVMDNATVEGDAQIRDYAVVKDNATVTDQARVIEHALVNQNGVVRDRGVVKGTATVFGSGTIEGTAVVDGDYASGMSLDSGTVFGWLPNKEIASNRPDHPDVHTEYTFEESSPALAIDTYGVNHGILRGNPETDGGALSLNGADQYVLLPDHVLDYRERYVEVEVNWDGGSGDQVIWAMGADEDSGMSLSVAGDGTVTFKIESDGDVHAIESDGSITPDAWQTIRVALDESGATLVVDGTAEGQAAGPLPTPVDMRSEPPQQNYLGRGIDPSVPRFVGSVRNFRVGSTVPE
jgi:carbonic anhydrase/acetyltransferase-like protein (isoleucine patch superfamily)